MRHDLPGPGESGSQAFVREAVVAHRLGPEVVRQLRDLYVKTPSWDAAAQALQARHAVALLGEAGTGRRITGVNLLADLGATPHELTLDPEDLERPLPISSGHGYLVDLEDLGDLRALELRAAASSGHLRRLPELRAYLVARVTEEVGDALRLEERMPVIRLRPPDDHVAVFRSHLARLRNANEAQAWSLEGPIIGVLRGARPSDAVRLARLVRDVLAADPRSLPGGTTPQGPPRSLPGGTTPQGPPRTLHITTAQLDAVLLAYGKWAGHLAAWFEQTESASACYERALLLAAAALEGERPTAVFAAADNLARLMAVPAWGGDPPRPPAMSRDPGGALTRPAAAELLAGIDAELTDGRIRFPRPAYADSVLDHVWRDRPGLRSDLERWLVELPADTDDAVADRAVYSLVRLAMRHRHPSLVTSAADEWAQHPALRALAVQALTAAGLSEELGAAVRRRLYHWATRPSTHEDVQLMVAEVCRGPLAHAFPRNALTRLRHLASRGTEPVRMAVAGAMAGLAADERLRRIVLGEVIGWIRTDDDSNRQATGRATFLRLVWLRDEAGQVLFASPASQAADLTLPLAEGWRAVLRHPGTGRAARGAALGWLGAAARDLAPREPIVDVFAGACRSDSDVGILWPMIQRWAHATTAAPQAAREEIARELLPRIADRDPLTRPLPPTRMEALPG